MTEVLKFCRECGQAEVYASEQEYESVMESRDKERRPEDIETTDLKPCPFCGEGDIKAHYVPDGFSLTCRGCNVVFYDFGSGDAIGRLMDRWNRREER